MQQRKIFYEKFIKASVAKEKQQIPRKKKSGTNTSTDREKNKIAIQYGKILKADNGVFSSWDIETQRILNSFDSIIRESLGITNKQETSIPKEIRILFHELTDERNSRKINYLSNPVKLSAYIYYYMWWNLVRICKLIKTFNFNLKDGDIIADCGAGPLTLACAFWITKPELRGKKLKWYCIDISSKALQAGEKIFEAICRHTENEKAEAFEPWKIIKITGNFGTQLKDKADLFLSANMFNEIFWESSVNISREAEKASCNILAYLKPNGKILIIEPGIPLAGKFISYLRKCFLEKKYYPQTPCPHAEACPIPGMNNFFQGKDKAATASGKWCHFAFQTIDTPLKLTKLSAAANLEKQRAALSFLYCTAEKNNMDRKQNNSLKVRITSDLIKLEHGAAGKYACSEKGFLLLHEKNYLHSKLKNYPTGTLLELDIKNINYNLKDKKTGAVLIGI